MSNDIKAGDLVYVAKPVPCCNDDQFIGHTGMVEGVHSSVTSQCGTCGGVVRGISVSILTDGLTVLTECLKKFEPKSAPDLREEVRQFSIDNVVRVIRVLVR